MTRETAQFLSRAEQILDCEREREKIPFPRTNKILVGRGNDSWFVIITYNLLLKKRFVGTERQRTEAMPGPPPLSMITGERVKHSAGRTNHLKSFA